MAISITTDLAAQPLDAAANDRLGTRCSDVAETTMLGQTAETQVKFLNDFALVPLAFDAETHSLSRLRAFEDKAITEHLDDVFERVTVIAFLQSLVDAERLGTDSHQERGLDDVVVGLFGCLECNAKLGQPYLPSVSQRCCLAGVDETIDELSDCFGHALPWCGCSV